jgi:hypothetical protein
MPFVLFKVWARKLLMLADRKLPTFRIFKSFWLETLPDSTTGAPAILAFLVVLRVLIKLFFSMLMMGSPLEILSDNFLLYRRACVKHGKGQTLQGVCLRTATEKKDVSAGSARARYI